MMKKITIAIDGHSSCGKSTMAKDLARTVGYVYVDTGAMYRCVTLYALRNGLFTADGINEENSAAVARIFEVIPKIAAAEGLSNGYRVITNCGEDGCQSVKHLHFHILGGKKLPDQMA